jgi:hypothetical protein
MEDGFVTSYGDNGNILEKTTIGPPIFDTLGQCLGAGLGLLLALS